MSGRSVVITGRGIVTPLGVGVQQYWEALMKGERADLRSPRLAALGLPSSVGASVPAAALLPHLARLPKKQQKLYNRMTLLAMVAAGLAMEEAGLPRGAGDPTRLGVFLGVNLVGWELDLLLGYVSAAESLREPGTLDMSRANAYCMHAINPLDYSLKTLPNLTAGHLAIAHDAQGLCRAYTDGPIGGLLAIQDAYHAIREGDLDVALCGGADAQTEELVYASAVGMGLVSEGEGGSIPAEGSALLVLEEKERAVARGARPVARVLGASSVLGQGRLARETDREALAGRLGRAMGEGLAAAGLPRADLLALHRDGVAAVDEAERLAVEALPDRSRPRATVALKPFHGHLGAASPPAELLACSLALEHGMIPRAISTGAPAVASGPPVTALVNAVGLFGEAACLALGAAGERGAG